MVHRAVFIYTFLLLILVLGSSCTGNGAPVELSGEIDFFANMDLIQVPAGDIRTVDYDDIQRNIKIGKEVRHCVKFPLQSALIFNIAGVPAGARFDFAVGFKAVSGSVPAGSFVVYYDVAVGEDPRLATVFIDTDKKDEWHDVSIDLADFEGKELKIRVESSSQSNVVRSFLAHPKLVIPSGSDAKRVIVICVDTLRSDTLGVYGNTMGMTPSMDAFATDTLRFANCESASPWTLPSCASFQTGRFPGMIAADAVSEHLREEETTLAEVFRPAGFRCASVTNNRYVSSEVGFFQGNEYQRESPKAPADEELNAGLDYLKKHIDEDVFLYIHLFDPHLPYDPPEPYLSRYRAGSGRFETEFSQPNEVRSGEIILTDEEKLQIEGLYNGCVAFADEKLGDFFEELKSLGIYDSSVIVLWADHGEEFWEHGAFEHGHAVYEEVTHVPLLMKFPGIEPGVIDTRVSLVDVMPTLLNWFDLDQPEGLIGRNLLADDLEADTTRRMFIEQCIHSTEKRASLEGDWKLILNFGIEAPVELYNLAVDPGELNNLAETETDIATRLADELLLYSAHTDEGAHVRLYNLPGIVNTDYELTIEVVGGEFSDVRSSFQGTLINESLGTTVLVSRVNLPQNGYIGLDFNVTPETADVKFKARVVDRPDVEFPWYLGSSTIPIKSADFELQILDERVSMSYPQARLTTAEGVYIWSIPQMIRDLFEGSISPETRAELDALGYLQ